jgi:hypothetical protein
MAGMWWSEPSGLPAYKALLSHMKKLNNSPEFISTSNGQLLDSYLNVLRSNSKKPNQIRIVDLAT